MPSPKPSADEELKAISLFSGAGGLDVGVLQAGFNVLAALEYDSNACDTLRANIEREGRSTLVLEGDIRQQDPGTLRKMLKLRKGELNLLFGGPPCQSFSLAGKRGSLSDPRGLLLFEMTRFAKEFLPRVVLVEQVKGILSAAGDGEVSAFNMLLSEFETLGYVPKWKVLVAADYGVPQVRERVFIVATRDKNGFAFPERTHAPAHEANESLFPLRPHRTLADALKGLGKPAPRGSEREDSHVDVTPDGDRRRINGVGEGSHLARELGLPPAQRGGLTRKDTTKFRRLHREKASLTLRCGEVFFHPLENRYLTPREYMRLHTFPDAYVLKGPIRGRAGVVKVLDQHRLIANSVPPELGRILAAAIRSYILCLAASMKSSGIARQTKAKKRN